MEGPPTLSLYHPPPPLKNPIKDILYGSAAGIVSKAIEHPFDLVKVRLQSQPLDRPFRYKGPIDCFVQTFKGEGIKGLWRGVSMPIGGAMLENATLFVVYNQTQTYLRKHNPPPQTLLTEAPYVSIPQMLISAALAGACASFVLTPVELVKCKMQVQNIVSEAALLSSSSSSITTTSSSTSTTVKPIPRPLSQPGPISITRSILLSEGPKGLWLGQTGTFLRETGGSAAWFTTFELLSSYFIQLRHSSGQRTKQGGRIGRGELSAGELMISGAVAGVVYNCLLFPVDCIKSTIQTEDELRGLGNKNGGGKGEEGRRSFLRVGKDIYNARGIKGLYQGCGLTALRAAPSSALIFYIYSRLESMFG